MRGELGMTMSHMEISDPWAERNETGAVYKHTHDLKIYNKDGHFLILCGDNDIYSLMKEAVEKYEKTHVKEDAHD